ncbi:hypothetical protein NE237_032559 [Protea cynaroides]|uniref:Transposase-associated domain-containing protein n=1 Tax=Protea cynaroides TaxID=273540 RepID=A0A9Q0L3J2_9MAGN|nr:hypothetical protein NE237_032559 [Protea cynaroides]
MSRSWVGGSRDPSFRLSSQYRQEVNKFIEYAFSNASCKGGRILCPCAKCINQQWRTADEVLKHLICDGFLWNYTYWNYHGEGSFSSTLHRDNIVERDEGERHDTHTMLNLPLIYKTWWDMPEQHMEDGWVNRKGNFDISERNKEWVLGRLNARWRDYKHTLKLEYYDKYDSIEDRKANIDVSKMPEELWYTLFDMWDSEESKDICQQNKDHKEKQKLRHMTRNTPYAVISKERQSEDPNLFPPSRIQTFEATHRSKKTGLFVDKNSAKTIEKSKERHSQESKERQADKEVQERVSQEVLGPDSHGRVCPMGPEVKPKGAFGTFSLRDPKTSQRLRELEERISKHGQMLLDFAEQMRVAKQYMHTSQLQSQSHTQTQTQSQPPS